MVTMFVLGAEIAAAVYLPWKDLDDKDEDEKCQKATNGPSPQAIRPTEQHPSFGASLLF